MIQVRESNYQKKFTNKKMLLPYVIVFFFLIIFAFALITVYFYLNHKLSGCNTNPNFWCLDTWYCPGDPTYGNSGVTGLASSLFGLNSNPLTLCGYTGPTSLTGYTCGCGWAGVVGSQGTTYLQQGCNVTFIPPS